MVKMVSLSVNGMCRVLVKIDSYSMSGMYCVQNSKFQHG
jgi:hypothetical protein